MLLIVIIALIILILILSLHYYQHFRFQCNSFPDPLKNRVPASSPVTPVNRRSTINLTLAVVDEHMAAFRRSYCRSKCCCSLTSVDGEEFDFFPMSFLFYLSFIILLCILIISVDILNFYYYENNESIMDFLFGYSIDLYRNNSLFEFHNINDKMNTNGIIITYVIDYILIYSIMILSVWESLFSFYRYYTTFVASRKFKTVSTTKIICKKFPFYAVIFCVLFIVQIHLYYFIFPIIIILFSVFNCYWTYKFGTMLIQQYETFIAMEDHFGYQTNTNRDILNSVRFMKNTSLICCVLQSVYLSLFVCLYNATIIYYFPILWAISGFISTINFVRNRKYLQRQLFRVKQYFNGSFCKKVKAHRTKLQFKRTSIKASASKRQIIIPKNVFEKSQDNINITSTKHRQFNSILGTKLPKFSAPTATLTISHSERRAKSNTNATNGVDNKSPRCRDYPLTKQEKYDHELQLQQNDSETMQLEKSLKISLNDAASQPVPVLNCLNNNYNENTAGSKQVSFNLPPLAPQDTLMVDFDVESPRSMRSNKALEVLGINISAPVSPMHSPRQSNAPSPTSTCTSKSKKVIKTPPLVAVTTGSGLAKSLSLKLSKSKSKSNVNMNMNMKKLWFVNSVSHDIENDMDDDEAESQDLNTLPLDHHDDQLNMHNGMVSVSFELNPSNDEEDGFQIVEDGFQFVFGDCENYITQDNYNINARRHEKNTSVHINVDELVSTLNALAKYGFCSRKSINSIKELSKYQKKVNENQNYGLPVEEINEENEINITTVRKIPFSNYHSTPCQATGCQAPTFQATPCQSARL